MHRFRDLTLLKEQTVDAVSAEAIDANGRVLISAGIAKTQQEEVPVPPALSLDENEDFRSQVPIGEKSRWQEYMILKVHRVYMNRLTL